MNYFVEGARCERCSSAERGLAHFLEVVIIIEHSLSEIGQSSIFKAAYLMQHFEGSIFQAAYLKEHVDSSMLKAAC